MPPSRVLERDSVRIAAAIRPPMHGRNRAWNVCQDMGYVSMYVGCKLAEILRRQNFLSDRRIGWCAVVDFCAGAHDHRFFYAAKYIRTLVYGTCTQAQHNQYARCMRRIGKDAGAYFCVHEPYGSAYATKKYPAVQMLSCRREKCTLGGIRTPNPRFRRPMPYPLGHEGEAWLTSIFI